jgi:hypothetical protein
VVRRRRSSAAGNRDERATSGASTSEANRNTDRADVKQGDLAKIDAISVSVVADGCGNQAKGANGNRTSGKNRK